MSDHRVIRIHQAPQLPTDWPPAMTRADYEELWDQEMGLNWRQHFVLKRDGNLAPRENTILHWLKKIVTLPFVLVMVVGYLGVSAAAGLVEWLDKRFPKALAGMVMLAVPVLIVAAIVAVIGGHALLALLAGLALAADLAVFAFLMFTHAN